MDSESCSVAWVCWADVDGFFDVPNVGNPLIRESICFFFGGEGRRSPSANPRLFLIPTDQQSGVGWSNQSLSSSETESQIDENLFQICRCDSDFSNSHLAHSPPFVVPFGRHCFVCFGENWIPPSFYVCFFRIFFRQDAGNPWIVGVPLPSGTTHPESVPMIRDKPSSTTQLAAV